MRRLITFCVLFLFSTLTESIPFLPEYQKEYPKQYQPVLPNTHTNFAQPQPQYSDSKYEGLITRETISQPPKYNYAIRNQPITQGRTVEEIQKELQEQQRPFIKERIDYKIQPPYTPVEIREIKLNTVPEPYIPQNFRHVENIGNIEPIRQSHPEANARATALNAKEAQIAITKPNLEQTNTYTPQKQYQDANLPLNYHQVRQLIQSNPKLQNVLASVKNKKRYLVVHPDGRVEHVDNLEPIIQKHPEHILVNAGTLRNHVPPINPHNYPVGASIPYPPHVPVPVTPKVAPTVATVAAAKATAVTGGPTINPVLNPRISHEPAKTAPATSTTAATVIKTPTTLLPAKTSTTPTAKLTVTATPSSSSAVVTSATSVPTTPYSPGIPTPPSTTTIDRNTNKPATSTTAATVIKTPITLSPTKTSTTPTTKLAVTAPPSSSAVVASATSVPTTPSTLGVPTPTSATTIDRNTNKPATSTTAATVIKTPITLSPTKTPTTPIAKLAVTATPSPISPAVVAPATSVPTRRSTPGVPISPTVTTKDGTMNKLHAALTTKSVVHPPVVSKPTPSSHTHINTLSTTASHTTSKASDTPTTTSKAPNSPVFSTSSSPTATSHQTNPIVNVTKSIPTKSATSSHSTATSDSSINKVNSDSSVSTSSNVTIPKTVADSGTTCEPCMNMDESSIPVESCATAGICAEVSPEVADDIPVFESDDNQSVGEPVVWFEATDSGFWDHILDDESYNVIYFINVPPQPIIEKDTKTTVFPNGTIIEEITETKRNGECDEPTVTKTVRLIEPKE